MLRCTWRIYTICDMRKARTGRKPVKSVFIREEYVTDILNRMTQEGLGRSPTQTAHVLIVAGLKALNQRPDKATAIVEFRRASEEARLDYEHPLN